MPPRARGYRVACGSYIARRRAGGSCWRPNGFSKPTRLRPRSSSAAPASSRLASLSTISRTATRPRARKSARMSQPYCAASPTRSCWSCDNDRARSFWIKLDPAGRPIQQKPLGLLAELTHRCPLGCPYCSNPLALDARQDELDTATWGRVFREAAELGVLQVHLSGGEPGARRDLVDITAGANAAGLYTNLITSAVGITDTTLGALAEAGLDHVQISIQDSEASSADHIAGYAGAFARKRTLATEVVRRKMPLTVNAVMHRANIGRIGEMVDLALVLGASRVEIAHVQYYGWALRNRAMLMPTREQVEPA